MPHVNHAAEMEQSLLSLDELEKILQLQQRILESVSFGKSHKEIIDQICNLKEGLLPNSVASVMLMDDKYECLNVYAAPSIPPEGVAQLNGLRPGPGAGSCGNVIYSQQPQFVSDTFEDARWSGLRQLAYDFNLRACWSVPIYSMGKVIGTFALSSFEHRSPTVFHRRILDIASSIIGIVLARQQDEMALRIAATAFESQNGMVITDADANILRTNHAFTEITGYTAEEVIGKNPRILNSGKHDAAFYKELWKSVRKDGRWQGEVWNRRKNGEVYQELLSITAVKDADERVTHYVGSLTDISMHKKAEAEIRHLANYDHLTDLANRRMFLDRLKHAMVNAERYKRSVALLFIDLDNFKMLNDTWGHEQGDKVLQQVASRLSAGIREADTVARLGGDEFVVIVENLDAADRLQASEHAFTLAEKIRAILAEPMQLDTHEYVCTPSIGISISQNGRQDSEELVKQADIAMYQAKNAGRNMTCLFDRSMQDLIDSRAHIQNELHRALALGQFQLHYQIQKNIDGRATGAEALIRWVHPERGLVSPAQFIPIAEESGLILPIGQWVIESACAQLVAWAEKPHTRGLALAVNVSVKQFHDPGFVEQIIDAVERYGIDPHLLKLELTESLLLKDAVETMATMEALNDIGVQLSLDDFGTGYSSLQYLRRLPLDQLKIDQTFVRNIKNSDGDRAIAYSIIALAKSLDLDVLAEGVETETQRQMLIDGGCENYQGYLFGKPVPIDQFEASLSG